MKKNMIICGILATLVIIGIRCSDNKNTSKNGEKVKDTLSLINRGKFLVTVGGCNDCHSPKIMTEHGPTLDPSRMLSGQNENEPIPAFDEKAVSKGIMQANAHLTAWKGPWGVSFSANITSDATGIGNWSLDQFKNALRKGKYKGMDGSRDLLPPMPWFNYKDLSDEDMEAVFLYLKSIPAVKNNVPAAIIVQH